MIFANFILLFNFLLLLFLVYFFNSILKVYKPLATVLILGVFTNALQIVLWSYEGVSFSLINSIFIIYTLLAFSILLYFFKKKFKDRILYIIFYSGILSILLTVSIRDFYYKLIEDFSKSTPTPLIGTIFIVAACLRVLFLFLKRVDSVDLYKKLDFWIVLIVLIYFVIQFVYLGYLNFFYAGFLKSYVILEIFQYLHHTYYTSLSLLLVVYGSTNRKRGTNSLLHL